ncbi:MAG: 4Fe-4S dicluster domain-containing protein [Muribaculum sp.]|nr:4Fe-4S dicluster domain-containing protein [Muribaculum sp.]
MQSKKLGKMLRLTRIFVTVISISLMTWLFVGYGSTYPQMALWLAKIQFLPATMAFSLATFIIWLIVTMCFGRIYCSAICPLGIFQDICARVPRMINNKPKSRWTYHFKKPHRKLPNIVLFGTVLSILLGISIITSLLDPYSIYARFSLNVLRPLWWGIINLTSPLLGTAPVMIASASLLGMTVSVVMILLVASLAVKNGRLYCNTICPVGTTLGFVSKYSVFRIDINTDKCIQCRKCEHMCKSSCIDLADHVIDMTRCVVCFDCLPECPNDAIHYTYNRHQLSIPLMQKVRNPLAGGAVGMDAGRRNFIVTGLIAAATPVAAKFNKATGLIEGSETASTVSLPVTPPGAPSRQVFLDRCTSCGLCVSRCPQRVLVPSTTQYGVLRALHPVMNYDRSWCLYDCTVCANVCPTGALRPLTVSEKHITRIGLAKVNINNCISYIYDAECGDCARECPTKAITMTQSDRESYGPYPVVDSHACIGCGACQHICPAHPTKAIIVKGLP